jgi:hypothetical protein
MRTKLEKQALLRNAQRVAGAVKAGTEHIVSVQGDRFLGWGGEFVSEYPDARIFTTKAAAEVAAGVVRVTDGRGARAVSVSDYQDGTDTGGVSIEHHAIGVPAGILACELRGLSHESLACLAANLLHSLAVARDMLKGEGLEARALEVVTDAVAQSGVSV